MALFILMWDGRRQMQYMYMYGQLCRKDTPVIASIACHGFIYLFECQCCFGVTSFGS